MPVIADLKVFRRRLDEAIAVLEAVEPWLPRWLAARTDRAERAAERRAAAQSAEESTEEAAGPSSLPADGSATPDGPPRRRRGRPRISPEERRRRAAESQRRHRERRKAEREAAAAGQQQDVRSLDLLPDRVERSWRPMHSPEPEDVTEALAVPLLLPWEAPAASTAH
jgi:hypothetical protein